MKMRAKSTERPIIWTEEMIRNEMERLDKKTGLDGAKLKIEFYNRVSPLGRFCPRKEEDNCYFAFSDYYLQDPDFPEIEKVDTIRHEYAHYYDYICFHGNGHGASWKYCCSIVGALPLAKCSNIRVNYLQGMKAKNDRLEDQSALYVPGKILYHPKYELGEIVAVSGEMPNKYVDVYFADCGERKRISVKWAIENCEIE